MAGDRSLVSIGPSIWNALSSRVRSTVQCYLLSFSFVFLKTCIFSRGLAQWRPLLNGSTSTYPEALNNGSKFEQLISASG